MSLDPGDWSAADREGIKAMLNASFGGELVVLEKEELQQMQDDYADLLGAMLAIDPLTALSTLGVDPPSKDWFTAGRTPVHYAASIGSLSAFKKLHSAYCQEAEDDEGNTALHHAALGGHPEMCEAILRKSTKGLSAENAEGDLPLHLAAKSGHADVIRVLLPHAPKHARAVDFSGNTPLHHAAAKGHAEVFMLLVTPEAKPEHQNDDGNTPLHVAVSNGNVASTRALLAVMPADVRGRYNRVPLHLAALKGSVECCELLLSHLDDPAHANLQDADGRAPLHDAAASGNHAVVPVLVGRGALLNKPDGDGSTALHLAAVEGDFATMKVLLNMKADYNVVDHEGRGPLHDAAQGGNEHCVKLLLSAGAQSGAKDDSGMTPLALATGERHDRCVRVLMSWAL